MLRSVKKVLEVKRKHLAAEAAELAEQESERDAAAASSSAAPGVAKAAAPPKAPQSRNMLETADDMDLLF